MDRKAQKYRVALKCDSAEGSIMGGNENQRYFKIFYMKLYSKNLYLGFWILVYKNRDNWTFQVSIILYKSELNLTNYKFYCNLQMKSLRVFDQRYLVYLLCMYLYFYSGFVTFYYLIKILDIPISNL